MAMPNRKKYTLRNTAPGYLFLLPALGFFLLFVVYPMISAIVLSFYDYSFSGSSFVGLQNFIDLFRNTVFLKSLANTFLLVVMNVPVVVLFSFFVAIVIYNKSEGVRSFIRAAYYLPAVSSIVSISAVWTYIYNPAFGVLPYVLGLFGVKNVDLLGNANSALPALAVVLFTLTVGQPVILFIAARGNVPVTYIEAAEIDGASRWSQTWRIVWPLLKPTTLYIIIITTINSFQTFAIVQLLTGGGPFHATSTIVFQLYKSAFEQSDFGLANAMGMVLAVIVILISVVQYTSLSNDVTY